MNAEQASDLAQRFRNAAANSSEVVELHGDEARGFVYVKQRPTLVGSFEVNVQGLRQFFVALVSGEQGRDANFQLLIIEKRKGAPIIVTSNHRGRDLLWRYSPAKQSGENLKRREEFIRLVGGDSITIPLPDSDMRPFSEAVVRSLELRHKADAAGGVDNAAQEDDASGVDAASAVFTRLVPDERTRRFIATVFAETIEQANAAGEGRWETTLHREFIRLNGGRVLVFDVRASDVFIAFDPAKLTEPTKERVRSVGVPEASFIALPQFLLFRLPHAEFVSLWDEIREAFRSYVAAAVLTARRCVWARFHSPALVEHLAAVSGKPIPQPNYGADDGDATERAIYWVNQGKTFEQEQAAGYLFAQKKDGGGATPNHWSRLQDLVPGDLVVHYAGGSIRAVSQVREGAVDASRHGQEGWRVATDIFVLPTPIKLSPLLSSVRDSELGPFDKNGGVKQGYLYEFTEEGLSAIRADAEDKDLWPTWTNPIRTRFWMFHATPDLYDVRGATRSLAELTWRVRQHKSEIRVGDTVFVWETGSRGGIVAVASVLTEPAIVTDDAADAAFRKSGLSEEDDELTVRLAIERTLDPIIAADDMRADPSLTSLAVFNSPQRTNSSVSAAQGKVLLKWSQGRRDPRIIKVAPGEGGELWSECLAAGTIRVGWDKVGDVRQYADWSSFRKAFGLAYEGGKSQGHITKKAQELWTLARLRAGDRVVANRGLSRVLGVGTVREPGYVWDASLPRFKQSVLVDWDTTNAGEVPVCKHWAMTTVDKVPANIIALVAPDLLGVVDDGGAPVAKAVPAIPSMSPQAERPFGSLLRALQSKESRLWFADEVVAHYILALQAKRFVILTGVSGTGKTQLALAVAKHFQPRTKRIRSVPPPGDAVAKRVSPYMRRGKAVVLPAVVGADLQFGGQVGTASTTVDVEFPTGTAQLSCYREVRSAASSVYHLSFKGDASQWMKSQALGAEIFFEALEPTKEGRDRIRISVPTTEEEVVATKNYEIVPVRPDWTDGRGLLGFYNPLTNRYFTTPFLRLLLAADEEAKRAAAEKRAPSPFFVILDEMNLARVEQYFSDFLSVLESGEPIALHDDARVESGEFDDEDDEVVAIPRRLAIPPNLFFTGTVNVDETTYMFSPKVLDRAFVIEFNEVDLDGYGMRDVDDEEDSPLELVGWQGFQPVRAVSADDWDALASVDGGKARKHLSRLHEILEQDNRHFGYRVANEIGRFIKLAWDQSADPQSGIHDALDLAIVSKVLPKLHGTQQELEDTLLQLLVFALGDGAPAYEAWSAAGGQLVCKEETEPRFPRSSLKLWRMLRRLRAQGFTSFIT